MSLRDAPIEDVLREVQARGYVIKAIRGQQEGDLAATPAIPLGAASVAELLSALSAKGWDLRDVRAPMGPGGTSDA